MAKTFAEYVEAYREILGKSESDVAISPKFWIFSTWQRDTGVTKGSPKQAVAILDGLQQSDPALHRVIMEGVQKHVDNLAEQERLQGEGANILEVIRAGNKRDLLTKEEARAELEALCSL